MIRSPSLQEHIFSITHHFEDGSKLLFAFIDRKLFFKAAVGRWAPGQGAPGQGAPAPSEAGAALRAQEQCLPSPLSCRICLGVKQYVFPLEGFVLLKLFFLFKRENHLLGV